MNRGLLQNNCMSFSVSCVRSLFVTLFVINVQKTASSFVRFSQTMSPGCVHIGYQKTLNNLFCGSPFISLKICRTYSQWTGYYSKAFGLRDLCYEIKEKYTGHIDWYLYNLSVRKEAQGKGIAKKILLPVLDFCDDEKMVTYLETNKESNVSMYERFGFKLKETNNIPGSRVGHYSMIRAPK